jgi:hypothetical protein
MRCKYGMRAILGDMATPFHFSVVNEFACRVVEFERENVATLLRRTCDAFGGSGRTGV